MGTVALSEIMALSKPDPGCVPLDMAALNSWLLLRSEAG